MKKFFTRIVSLIVSAFSSAMANLSRDSGMGYRLKQGGFVQLTRPYAGYDVGRIVELPASTEAALIASGGATASNGPPTPGTANTTALQGCGGVPAGSSTLLIVNPAITPQTILFAQIVGTTIDATATSIARINCTAGQAAIVLNANGTGQVNIDWAIMNPLGSLSSPQ